MKKAEVDKNSVDHCFSICMPELYICIIILEGSEFLNRSLACKIRLIA